MRASHRVLSRSGSCVILGAVFASLTVWSWQKWPDLFVDFGRMLYIPWQLSQGAVLYRDIAHAFGPLSQYLHAALFDVFGVSLLTLAIPNLLGLAGLTAVIYRLFRKGVGRDVATIICVVFLGGFGFAHYFLLGNYNFICPYAYELTHGVMLSVLMIWALVRAARTERPVWLVLAGGCLGLTALTKPEVYVAAAGTCFTALGLRWLTRPVFAQAGSLIGWVSFGAVGSVLGFGVVLLFWMGAPEAWMALGGAWAPMQEELWQTPFYQRMLGTDRPLIHAVRMLWGAGILAAFVLGGLIASRVVHRWMPVAGWQQLVLTIGGSVAMMQMFPTIPAWAPIGWGLPLIVAAGCAWGLIACVRVRDDRAEFARRLPFALWAVFSVLLLAKMVLNAQWTHIGFALAMPAALLLVSMLLGRIPGIRLPPGIFRTLALSAIIAWLAVHLGVTLAVYQAKTLPVGRGADRILGFAGGRDRALQAAWQWLEASTPPQATVVVMPEGIMLNYLARRASPIPYTGFFPFQINLYGEAPILRSLAMAPPEVIVFVPRPMEEYGHGELGEGYARDLIAWVEEYYRVIHRIPFAPGSRDPRAIRILVPRAGGHPDRSPA